MSIALKIAILIFSTAVVLNGKNTDGAYDIPNFKDIDQKNMKRIMDETKKYFSVDTNEVLEKNANLGVNDIVSLLNSEIDQLKRELAEAEAKEADLQKIYRDVASKGKDYTIQFLIGEELSAKRKYVESKFEELSKVEKKIDMELEK